MAATLKPTKVFKSRARSIEFYKSKVIARFYCAVCRVWDCSSPYSYTKGAIRRLLKNEDGTTVSIGCKTFRGEPLAYARRWVKR